MSQLGSKSSHVKGSHIRSGQHLFELNVQLGWIRPRARPGSA